MLFNDKLCDKCGLKWQGHIYVGFGLLACPSVPSTEKVTEDEV